MLNNKIIKLLKDSFSKYSCTAGTRFLVEKHKLLSNSIQSHVSFCGTIFSEKLRQ